MTPAAAHHFFLLSVLTIGTILLIAVTRAWVSIKTERLRARPDAAFATDLAEIKTRLASVETILRDAT